jgi:SSS family solute:Na+ symporter
MALSFVDWSLIVAYFVLSLVVGSIYAKRAGKGIESFFISERALPWWLAGTSMVATTFAADTPLAVTEIVVKNGIAGNWLWWNFVLGGMMTVFLFSKLWRRSEVLTDIEFTELRYSGKPAAILRGFRAVYLGLPINCMIMAWVTLAMTAILEVTFSFPKILALVISLVFAVFYTVLSGLWGVVITDFFQFIIAMAGSISLAVIAVIHVGGIKTLKLKVLASHPETLSFFPKFGSATLPLLTFFVYVAVQWWSTWYPGAEPGGGGYVAQRILASKDEKHSMLATLWFNIAHYALRPWPWILVALAVMIVFPNLADPKLGYPKMVVSFLPVGLKGLMIAAFFAAFMSTIVTHLNWGASYLVNDFYKRFVKKDASSAHYILISRILTVLLMIFAGIVAYQMESIKGAWELLLAIGAGTGLVYILRWYWWRINAWSEISAMASSFVVAMVLLKTRLGAPGELNWAYRMLITVGITTLVWLAATFLTRPVDKDHLVDFYRKIRPAGMWKPISLGLEKAGEGPRIQTDLLNWLLGTGFVYCSLFGIGKIVFLEFKSGIALLLAAAFLGIWLYKSFLKKKATS